MKKRAVNKNNKSGTTGVFWNKTTERWHARLKYGGKEYHLGTWQSFNYAARMRKQIEDLLAQREIDIRAEYR